MMTAHLVPNEENIKKGDDDVFSLVSQYNDESDGFYMIVEQ